MAAKTRATAERDFFVARAERDIAERKLIDIQRRAELVELEKAQRSLENMRADADTHRIFTFYSSVNAETVHCCMETLADWHRRDPGKSLTVVLNSPGGYCVDGIALYDFMLWLRAEGHELTIVTLGEASSMGGIILQAGDKRIMGRTSELLIHEVSAGSIGSVSKIEDKAKYLRKLNNRLFSILAERSSMDTAQISRKAKSKDWILTASEALELGFIDEVR